MIILTLSPNLPKQIEPSASSNKPFRLVLHLTFIDLRVRCVDLPLHVDVSWLRNVVPSFSLCSDHHTTHTHASRTVALCFSHANLCCIVLNSLCALGNVFSLALCHMLVAARVAPGSCDQYSKPMYESLQISPGRLLNLLLALR